MNKGAMQQVDLPIDDVFVRVKLAVAVDHSDIAILGIMKLSRLSKQERHTRQLRHVWSAPLAGGSINHGRVCYVRSFNVPSKTE